MPGRSKKSVSPKEESVPGRVFERPDGFYWESKETKELRGPFATRAEADADLLAGGGADGEFDPESETRAARRKTTSRTSKITEASNPAAGFRRCTGGGG